MKLLALLLMANDFLLNDFENGVDSALQYVFGVYRTKEVKALFKWIQDYNSYLSKENKITLEGCDIQDDISAYQKLLDCALEKGLFK